MLNASLAIRLLTTFGAHTVMVPPRELAERHGLDMLTPLLTISRRMRCTRCALGRVAVGRRRMTRDAAMDREMQR